MKKGEPIKDGIHIPLIAPHCHKCPESGVGLHIHCTILSKQFSNLKETFMPLCVVNSGVFCNMKHCTQIFSPSNEPHSN
jgi:hypothetical protein